MRIAPFFLLLTLGLFACEPAPNANDVLEPPQPTSVPFEGAPDPALAGTWKTQDGQGTYLLDAAGSFVSEAKRSTQGGVIETKVEGEWKVHENQVLFKDQQGIVVPYDMKLEGDKLTLTLTGSMKSETVLLRQPAP